MCCGFELGMAPGFSRSPGRSAERADAAPPRGPRAAAPPRSSTRCAAAHPRERREVLREELLRRVVEAARPAASPLPCWAMSTTTSSTTGSTAVTTSPYSRPSERMAASAIPRCASGPVELAVDGEGADPPDRSAGRPCSSRCAAQSALHGPAVVRASCGRSSAEDRRSSTLVVRATTTCRASTTVPRGS